MNKINLSNSSESENENSSKLLGKKRILFSVEKDCENNKKSSSEKYSEDNLSEGRWSYNEQIKFIEGLSKAGTNWKKFKEIINTRTLPQIRSHAQKFFKKLKRCKNNELGIDFTSNSIRSIKDMINHIKTVNKNYDISNVFIHLCDNQQKEEKINLEDFYKKNYNVNKPNISPQVLNKDNLYSILSQLIKFKDIFKYIVLFNYIQGNNNFCLNNLNKDILLHSLNNLTNNLNVFTLDYLNKLMIMDILIDRLNNNNYFEKINKTLFNAEQLSSLNIINLLNNSNFNEIRNNLNIL